MHRTEVKEGDWDWGERLSVDNGAFVREPGEFWKAVRGGSQRSRCSAWIFCNARARDGQRALAMVAVSDNRGGLLGGRGPTPKEHPDLTCK
jgi:hypothetical protein